MTAVRVCAVVVAGALVGSLLALVVIVAAGLREAPPPTSESPLPQVGQVTR